MCNSFPHIIPYLTVTDLDKGKHLVLLQMKLHYNQGKIIVDLIRKYNTLTIHLFTRYMHN